MFKSLYIVIIAVIFTGCNLHYTNYNKPFDFLKLKNDKVKQNNQEPDDIVFIDSSKTIQTSFTEKVDTNPIVNIERGNQPFTKNKPTEKKVSFEGRNNLAKHFSSHSFPSVSSNTTTQPVSQLQSKKPNDFGWSDVLWIFVGTIAVLFLMAVLLRVLQSTPVGQIVLAGIILILLIAGIILAIAESNTVLLDLLDLIFWLAM